MVVRTLQKLFRGGHKPGEVALEVRCEGIEPMRRADGVLERVTGRDVLDAERDDRIPLLTARSTSRLTCWELLAWREKTAPSPVIC